MKKYNIVQIGSFDVENYGDLLFADVFEKELKKRIDVENIYLFSPLECKMPFYGLQIYALENLEAFLKTKNIDAIIIGGGDMIRLDKNVTLDYEVSYKVSVEFWQSPILLGNKYNIPVLFNAPGVPFKFDANKRKISGEILNLVQYLSVRDDSSNDLLKEIGVLNCKTSPDTINIIPNSYGKEELKNIKDGLIENKRFPDLENYVIFQHHNCMSKDNESYMSELKTFVNNISKDCEVILFPIGYVHKDEEFLKELKDIDNNRVHLLTEKYHPVDMLAIIANANAYIGTSLHGIITSNIYNVPMLAINIANLVKIKGYLKLVEKLDLMVDNIEELENIYKTKLYNQDFAQNSNIIDLVNKHFDTISKMICEKEASDVESKDVYTKIITSAYEEMEQIEVEKNKNTQYKLDIENYKNELNKIQNRKIYKIINKFDKFVYKFKKNK